MNPTKNDLPESKRSKVVELLSHRLADSIDLKLQAKQAHWNVKGPNFYALHLLFDKVAEEIEEYVDLIAERIIQLGGWAEGTAVVVAKRTSLKEYPLSLVGGREHVEYLATAIAATGKQIRAGIDATDEFGDADTADILTQVSRGLDKLLWMVEAHLQEK
jgi:starvation-inducible DNA-binding protein